MATAAIVTGRGCGGNMYHSVANIATGYLETGDILQQLLHLAHMPLR
jgi:hypothetical protein